MTTLRPDWRLLADPGHLLALGFGTGLAPTAPGTFGTLAGVVLYLPASRLALLPYLGLTLALLVLGVWLSGRCAGKLGVHDHPAIVWDEVVGLFVTMTAAPPGAGWLLAGFGLFRLFDILKPWPIAVLDRRLGGGLGIMLDDVLAGVVAALCLQLAAWVLGAGGVA